MRLPRGRVVRFTTDAYDGRCPCWWTGESALCQPSCPAAAIQLGSRQTTPNVTDPVSTSQAVCLLPQFPDYRRRRLTTAAVQFLHAVHRPPPRIPCNAGGTDRDTRCLKIFFFSAKRWPFCIVTFSLFGNTAQILWPFYLLLLINSDWQRVSRQGMDHRPRTLHMTE